jgi:CheY-like chemotaxis protein
MKQGYEVQVARDGAEAIALCEDAAANRRPFAVALLDLTVSGGMREMEAAARLKELDPDLKLIVSSGYADNRVMADYEQYGFDDVNRKPWAVAQVREVRQAGGSGRRAPQEVAAFLTSFLTQREMPRLLRCSAQSAPAVLDPERTSATGSALTCIHSLLTASRRNPVRKTGSLS